MSFRKFVLGGACLVIAAMAICQDKVDRDFQIKVVDAAAKYKEGKTEESLKAFEDLFKINPKSSDVLAWLGFLYLRVDRAKDAVPMLEAAAKDRPNDLEVMNNLGNAYMITNADAKAVAQYTKIATLNPKMYEPWYNIGNIRLRSKDWKNAIVAYKKAAEINPKAPFVYNNIGVASEKINDIDGAASAFAKAATMAPTNASFVKNAAYSLLKTKSPEKALPYLEKLVLLNKEDFDARLVYGDALWRSGDKKKALEQYEALMGKTKETASFYFNLGVLRAFAKNVAGAEEAYRKALDLDGNDLDALNNLGILLYKKGQYEEAKTLFDKLSGLNPSSKDAKKNLAAAAVQCGDLETAKKVWKDMLKAEPSNVGVRLDLANALWQTDDSAGARQQFMIVLQSDPNNSEALNGMGLYHLKQNSLQLAEAAFKQSIAGDSRYLPAYNNLAVTLERLNRRKEAIALLEKALKIDPQNAEIKKNLERLKSAV